MRILVIDDDRMFTEPLLWRLRHEGFEVVYASRVEEALDGWYELTEAGWSLGPHDHGAAGSGRGQRFLKEDSFRAEAERISPRRS